MTTTTRTQITLPRSNGEIVEFSLDPKFGECAIGVFANQAQYDAQEMPSAHVELSREETSTLLELLRQLAMQSSI